MLDSDIGKASDVGVLAAEIHALRDAGVEISVDLDDSGQRRVRQLLRGEGHQIEVAHARDVVSRGQ